MADIIDLQNPPCPNCQKQAGWVEKEAPPCFECRACGFRAQPEAPSGGSLRKTVTPLR